MTHDNREESMEEPQVKEVFRHHRRAHQEATIVSVRDEMVEGGEPRRVVDYRLNGEMKDEILTRTVGSFMYSYRRKS